VGAQLSTGGKGGRVTPNINVTPLVDVVLVLLIIFMVIIPNVQDDKPIELVTAKNPSAEDGEDSDYLTITVDRRQVYTVGEDDTTLEGAKAALAASYAENPNRRVLLRGDSGLEFAVMRELFTAAQMTGFETVMLAVGKQREESFDGPSEAELAKTKKAVKAQARAKGGG